MFGEPINICENKTSKECKKNSNVNMKNQSFNCYRQNIWIKRGESMIRKKQKKRTKPKNKHISKEDSEKDNKPVLAS